MLAVSLSIFAPWDKSRAADARPSQLPLYHDARDVHLENGLQVLFVPNPKPAQGASLRLVVRVGNLHEEPTERGYAHFIEHLAFSAAPSFQAVTPQRQFARAGASLGPDINALTSPTDTIYQLELPDAAHGQLDLAFRWFAEIAGALEFRPDNVEPARAVIEAELSARSDSNLRAMAAEAAFLGPAHRYRNSLTGGDKAVVLSATPAQLQAFYRKWYRASNMHLVVVSDIPTARLEGLVRRHFEPLRPSLAQATGVDPLGDTASVGLHLDADLPVTSARIRTLKPQPANVADSPERRIRRLRLRLLLDGLTRRIRALQAANQISILDGVAAVGEFIPGYDSTALVTTGPATQWQAVLTSADRELRRFYRHGLTDTELAEQKTRMIGYFEQLSAASHGVRGGVIADRAARDLSRQRTFIDAHTELALARAAIQNFGQREANALVREFLAPGNWRIFLAGPPGAGLNLTNVDRVLAESRAHEPVALTANLPKPFAYAHPGPAVAPHRREAISQYGVLRLHYANGVVVNLAPTDFQRGSILIALRVGHGAASVPPGEEHLLALANQGLIAGGLEAHSIAEVSSLFAGRRVGGRFHASFDAFEFHGETNSDDLLDQLRIFAAFLMAPGLREPGLRAASRELASLQDIATHSVDGVLGSAVSKFLRGGDLRFGYPHKTIDLERDGPNLAGWLRPQLRQGPIEINIVGDVLPREAMAALDASFGVLPKRGPFPTPDERRYHLTAPPPGSTTEFALRIADDRGLVLLAWPVPDRRDHTQALALEVLSTIINERIRRRLRDELGLVYQYYSAYQTIRGATNFGLLTVQAIASGSNMAQVAREMMAAVAQLRKASVLRRDFEIVHRSERQRFKRLLAQNNFWLNAISGSHRRPEKLHWIEAVRQFEDLQSITLHRIATDYLQPEMVRIIFIRPQTR